jgi:hypothetical protein
MASYSLQQMGLTAYSLHINGLLQLTAIGSYSLQLTHKWPRCPKVAPGWRKREKSRYPQHCMHACVHVCIMYTCACVYMMYVCVCILYVYTYMNAYIHRHTYVCSADTWSYAYIHTCMYVSVFMYMCTHKRSANTKKSACMHVGMNVCVFMICTQRRCLGTHSNVKYVCVYT